MVGKYVENELSIREQQEQRADAQVRNDTGRSDKLIHPGKQQPEHNMKDQRACNQFKAVPESAVGAVEKDLTLEQWSRELIPGRSLKYHLQRCYTRQHECRQGALEELVVACLGLRLPLQLKGVLWDR